MDSTHPSKFKMQYLPAEVLLLIFGNLKKSDLKNVRLVNPDWCEVTTELLFDRIFVSGRRIDIETFTKWTTSRRCRAPVKELVFDMSMMDPDLSLRRYMNGLWWFIHDHLAKLDLNFRGCHHPVQEIFHHIRTGRLLGPEEETPSNFLISGNHDGPEAYLGLSERDLWFELNNAPASALCQNPIVVKGYRKFHREAKFERQMNVSGELLALMVQGLKNLPNIEYVSVQEEHLGAFDRHGCYFDPISLAPLSDCGSPFKRSWHPMYLLPFDGYGLDRETYTKQRHEFTENFKTRFPMLIRALSLSEKKVPHLKLYSDQKNPFPTGRLKSLFGSGETMPIHFEACLR